MLKSRRSRKRIGSWRSNIIRIETPMIPRPKNASKKSRQPTRCSRIRNVEKILMSSVTSRWMRALMLKKLGRLLVALAAVFRAADLGADFQPADSKMQETSAVCSKIFLAAAAADTAGLFRRRVPILKRD